MNRLSTTDRTRILQLLCEGMSIRAIERATGVTKQTVTRLLNDAGRALGDLQDRTFRNLNARRVQVDEIWSFTYAKQRNVPTAKTAPDWAGDTWTWTAIDADSKLVMSWLVGGRDSDYAIAFMDDLASRLAHRVQLTSDGHKAYLEAVEGAFGADIDYATLEKIYKADPRVPAGRYSPPVCTGAKKRRVEGDPDPRMVSTSYVERQNLTMRMHMRRFTRLTNAFSKKIEHHANAVALHFAYYNLVKVHSTLRMTPAMAAGVTDRLWEMADLVAVIEAAERPPCKRGPYGKRRRADAPNAGADSA
jgi:IS1 family transposase